MLRTIIKYAVWLVCIYGLYKSAEFYSAYKMIGYAQECDIKKKLCEVKLKKEGTVELINAMNKGYQCISDKQSWIEKHTFGVPKGFLNLGNKINSDTDENLKKGMESLKC